MLSLTSNHTLFQCDDTALAIIGLGPGHLQGRYV